MKDEVRQKNELIELQRHQIQELEDTLRATTINNQVPEDMSQDSLAFDVLGVPVPNNIELLNQRLILQLQQLAEQYYQWKLACIFTVDRARQMAEEMRKIDNNYTIHNHERLFGLTSWALVDRMFAMPTTTTRAGDKVVDWSQHGWDYRNEVVSTVDNHGPPSLLWPHPSDFVHNVSNLYQPIWARRGFSAKDLPAYLPSILSDQLDGFPPALLHVQGAFSRAFVQVIRLSPLMPPH